MVVSSESGTIGVVTVVVGGAGTVATGSVVVGMVVAGSVVAGAGAGTVGASHFVFRAMT